MKRKEPPILPFCELRRTELQPNVRFITASGRVTSVTPKTIKATPKNRRNWAKWFVLECYEEAKYVNDQWNLIFLEYAAKKIQEDPKWHWSPSEGTLYGDYLIRVPTPSNIFIK